MKKLLRVAFVVCVLMGIGSFVQAIEIDSPPYLNLSPGSAGDGGLVLDESAFLSGGHSFPHGTISVTLTNNNLIEMLSVQFIPNILLWEWRDSNSVLHQDKLYHQSDSGNSVIYANNIAGKNFVTRFTYTDYTTIDYYDVDDAFPAFWSFSWNTYSAGVDSSDNNKFYGKSLGSLDPNESITFFIETYTTVNGTPFPNVQWGVGGNATQFDFDWDTAGIPIPEPVSILLLGISAVGLFLRKRIK